MLISTDAQAREALAEFNSALHKMAAALRQDDPRSKAIANVIGYEKYIGLLNHVEELRDVGFTSGPRSVLPVSGNIG
jgi:hypothetical protein